MSTKSWESVNLMNHLLLALLLLLLPSSPTPSCSWVVQHPCFDPAPCFHFLHSSVVQVKQCYPWTQQIAHMKMSMWRCCLPLCSKDRIVPSISPFWSTEVCRKKAIFYWRVSQLIQPKAGFAVPWWPSRGIQGRPHFLCVCLLSYLWSPVGGRDLPSTNMNTVWLQIVVWGSDCVTF